MTGDSRTLIAALVTFAAGLRPVPAQEVGTFVGGGVGGIRDVRRPFGGGVTGTLMFHDWIGVRGSAAYYWTLEHRLAPICHHGDAEPVVCTSTRLASHSHFPQLDGLLMVRGSLPGRGVGLELGAGPTWVNVTNEIRTDRDSVYSSRRSSSAAGFIASGGVFARPNWRRLPVTFEATYAYHGTAKFAACAGDDVDPLCNRNLNFHELRFGVLYRAGRKALK
jgi:opacity protein-like surface antigen